MTLQQLRYFCEIVRQGLNISKAAAALHTSQPGISKQIKEIENELGAALFVRSRKRIVRLTKAGQSVLKFACIAVGAADNIRRVGKEFASPESGDLTVATTHTHARYALPKTIAAFVRRYPRVRLSLRQGNPIETAAWVTSGEADLGITAAPLVPFPNLVLLPCYQQHHIVLAKPGHPFLREKQVSLDVIAKYPMITYDVSFTGRAQIARAFAEKNLVPHVVVSATDADVMKAYVKQGLGIAIVAQNVYVPSEDRGLRMVDVRHLFEPNTVHVVVHREGYLRSCAYEFIELFVPRLTRAVVERAIHAAAKAK
ncbi:MAG: LysR family transcriptional regulator [Betaproteobacteria bacterium]|nr:LysR family transcriptional regulator [Betaproteobacteria bacterium]